MDIFSVFTLCGGLAFFLYGMTVMSKSLEKMAGGKLERMLKRMTSSPFKSLLLGAGITIAIQSSAAMTVMLVGLVDVYKRQIEDTSTGRWANFSVQSGTDGNGSDLFFTGSAMLEGREIPYDLSLIHI